MAFHVRGEASIDLTDYFEKFGFGDGDDEIAMAAGHRERDRAIDLLREEFQAVGLSLYVREHDVSSMHNTCYIEVYNAPNADSDKQIGLYDGQIESTGGLTPDEQERFLKAFKKASRRFDKGSRARRGSFKARGVRDKTPEPKPLTAQAGAKLMRTLAKEDDEHAQEFTQIAALLEARPH